MVRPICSLSAHLSSEYLLLLLIEFVAGSSRKLRLMSRTTTRPRQRTTSPWPRTMSQWLTATTRPTRDRSPSAGAKGCSTELLSSYQEAKVHRMMRSGGLEAIDWRRLETRTGATRALSSGQLCPKSVPHTAGTI